MINWITDWPELFPPHHWAGLTATQFVSKGVVHPGLPGLVGQQHPTSDVGAPYTLHHFCKPHNTTFCSDDAGHEDATGEAI